MHELGVRGRKEAPCPGDVVSYEDLVCMVCICVDARLVYRTDVVHVSVCTNSEFMEVCTEQMWAMHMRARMYSYCEHWRARMNVHA